jgi:4-aminobutyrate aminotransferase
LKRHSNESYGETVVRYIEEQIIGKVIPEDDLAGVLIEPIQGEGGYIVPAEGFFPALRKLCDKYGALLIADEVQSGMGRTGKWWAIENFGVVPDIITAAKGIASGVPLGAMIAKKSVMTWPKGAHGNTYGGNPVASAAALATIDIIEKELMANALEMGLYMKGALEEIQSSHDSIGDVRGIGLMLGVDFVKDRDTRDPDPGIRNKVEREAFEHGLVSLGCGKSTIRFAPPLSITKSEIDEGLRIFDYAVTLAEKK